MRPENLAKSAAEAAREAVSNTLREWTRERLLVASDPLAFARELFLAGVSWQLQQGNEELRDIVRQRSRSIGEDAP